MAYLAKNRHAQEEYAKFRVDFNKNINILFLYSCFYKNEKYSGHSGEKTECSLPQILSIVKILNFCTFNSKFAFFSILFLVYFTRMQAEMPCGWSRLVAGPLGKQGVKGHVEEFVRKRRED
jgi:hypothetical protein